MRVQLIYSEHIFLYTKINSINRLVNQLCYTNALTVWLIYLESVCENQMWIH